MIDWTNHQSLLLIIMYMFLRQMVHLAIWEILLTTSTNGGETFDKPKNISNNPGESREPDLALLQ